MFQAARRTTLNPHLRKIHTSSRFQGARRQGVTVTLVSTAVAATALWYSSSRLHNDALPRPQTEDKPKTKIAAFEKPKELDVLYSMVWGSNANKTILPDRPDDEILRTPTIAQWLNGVALRDLQLHQKHAACVDARGDVYQWGDGFFGETRTNEHPPKLTLRGKNIVQLQLTDGKIYALSASGTLYALSADIVSQQLRTGSLTTSSDSWWGTSWFWGKDETVDFAEIKPSEHLGWRESFVSIKAGKSHLLALTSKGRVYAHPVTKSANHYGQLGFSKISIPDPAPSITRRESHLDIELTPKSLADPFAKSSRAARIETSTRTSGNLVDIDDKAIRFCPYLFEVPVLRDINVAEIAAGERTSFVRTSTGRVLGWGANEYGQIGLGSNVALDTITVPTEVILWRFTSNGTKSKCLNVTAGGDLTAFTVEREANNAPATTDLLISGNGQYGGLGNNMYTTSQSNPSRVKAISGLVQYSDRLRRLEPIKPETISISPTGHILLALDSVGDLVGVGGRDLMIWGRNQESELGNGKKASLAIPTGLQSTDGERFMLMSKKAKEVKDLQGKLWKRGVRVEQDVVAGFQSSAVYWKIT